MRRDPLLATACGKEDPLDQERPFHRGAPRAVLATLTRMELSNRKHPRAHNLPHDPQNSEALLLRLGARGTSRA